MATRTDANAIAGHLDGTLRRLFNEMTADRGGLDALQAELDRFTMGNVPGNRDTARLVAVALVRRRRLAHTGILRDEAEGYLTAMARGRTPPPKPPNALSSAVHVGGDPYDEWGEYVSREQKLAVPFARALGAAWTATATAVSFRDLAEAIATARRLTSPDYWAQVGERLVANLAKTVVGYIAGGGDAGVLGAVSAPGPAMLDTATERSRQWAARYSAGLIRDINADQEKTYREMVTRAFEEGIGAEELAWRLRNSGLGLHSRWAAAVDNYQADLIEQGLPLGRARHQAGLYAAHLRDVRADVIARTEIITAMNNGRLILWDAAIQRGDLPTDVSKRWVTALDERVCPVCKPLNNRIVAMDAYFEVPQRALAKGQKAKFLMPPAHPLCRCLCVLDHPDARLLPARVA